MKSRKKLNRCLQILTLIGLSTLPAIALAQQQAVVEINGLVCDFCARSLEKTFLTKPEVARIDVNLQQKHVTLHFKPKADLSDQTITELIVNAGYEVRKIKREQ